MSCTTDRPIDNANSVKDTNTAGCISKIKHTLVFHFSIYNITTGSPTRGTLCMYGCVRVYLRQESVGSV